MWKIIFKFAKLISLYFLILAIKVRAYNICAFILWLNIGKFKELKQKNKYIKKILIFPKSGGNEDIAEAFKDQKNSNIIFYSLSRSFLKEIYSYCFKDNPKFDYFTKIKRSQLIYKKEYIDILTNIFNSLNKFLKLDGFISFNIFYYAEKHFEEVCVNLNKKFIILHKESVLTPNEEANYPKAYKKYNQPSKSHKISVYSKSQKKILIQSGIANKNQIKINGCPRSDYSFKLRKIHPKKKIIVFFLIETNRNSANKFQRLFKKSNFSWDELYNKTTSYLVDYAKKNPDVILILKGKVGKHFKEDFNSIDLPENCNFIDGGTGEKFLKDAKVIIAFNSTIVFETMASNRNLIIPNFNNDNKKRKEIVHKIENKKYLVNTQAQLNERLDFYLNSRYTIKKLNKFDKKTLEYYLGNSDGKSGKRLSKFLNNCIN